MLREQTDLQKILTSALRNGGRFADIFQENRQHLAIEMKGGKVTSLVPGQSVGAGIRVIADGTMHYSATTNLEGDNLDEMARRMTTTVGGGPTYKTNGNWRWIEPKTTFPIESPPDQIAQEDKLAYCQAMNDAAWAADPRIVQVIVRYIDKRQKVIIANSDGQCCQEDRSLVECRLVIVMREGSKSQMVVDGFGGYGGFELCAKNPPDKIVRPIVESAARMLHAKPAPAGTMTVIIANGRGRGGAVFHEACGHGMEADFIRRGISVYRGLRGTKVANDQVSIIDDALVPGGKGSYLFDDEATPGQRTIIINHGVLESYLHDRFQSDPDCPSTGNGRRESFRHVPIPRMSNIFLDRGNVPPDDIIGQTPKGFYALTIGGGIVDSSTGDFSFNVQEGYLIENGRLTAPVSGAVLIGNGPKMLWNIDLVGNDLEYDPGLSFCGKADQMVPSGLGCPTFRIRELMVGGSQKA